MNKKAQVAVEFLTTYGWVIVGILLLFAILFYYGSFDPTRFMPNQCSFEQGLQCKTYRFQGATSPTSPMRLTAQFSNSFAYDIAFSGNTSDITVENVGDIGKHTYVGNCSPMVPNIVKKNALLTCVFDIYNQSYVPPSGKKIKFQVEINYTNCVTDPGYFSNGSCVHGSNYTTVGTILTPLESNLSLTYGYCGDTSCNYPSENPNNCPSDCPPPKTIIVNVSPNLIIPDGIQYSNATAKVYDKNNNLIKGIDVTFISTPIGTVSNYTATTDPITGIALVRITSTVNGTADVSATSYGVSNSTKLTFQSIPTTLLLSSYDPNVGTCGGSYITSQVLDSHGLPLSGIPVNFSLNVSSAIANVSPTLEISDVSGYAMTYITSNTIGLIKANASVDLSVYNVHLKASTVVTVVGCQACNAPVQGDWIIDKAVDCENTTIILNGNLNISFDFAYMRKWGDLTFKNVTLILNSSSSGYNGQRGIYMNRMARFRVLDNDNNATTTADASNITAGGSTSYPFIFNIKPSADTFIMRNSYLSGAGYRAAGTVGNVSLTDISDYRSGLFISPNSVIIQNSTFSMFPYPSGLASIILNGSSNATITGNVFKNVNTGVALVNASNNTISNNTISLIKAYTVANFLIPNPAIFLDNASSNSILSNYVSGASTPGPGILLEDASTGNYVANNYFTGGTYEIYLDSSNQNKFYGNNIFNFKTIGVYMGGSYTYNETFQNNYLNNGDLSAGGSYQIFLSSIVSSSFINNTLGQASGVCYGNDIFAINGWNNYFTDNDMYGCKSMYVINCPNIVVNRMNVKTDARNQPYSISLSSVPWPYNYACGNITNSNNIGNITLNLCGSGNNIINNSINGSGSTYGISVTNSSATISGNVIDASSCAYIKNGISSAQSAVTISNNTIRKFQYAGINLNNSGNPSLAGSIANNSIINTWACGAKYGIAVANATPVGISGNNINNDTSFITSGISFVSSDSVVSYNNITTWNGVICSAGTLPLLIANNITSVFKYDDCVLPGSCVIIYTGGIWTVSSAVYCQDTTPPSGITGNITITSTGRLILNNVTFTMNPSSPNAKIWVQSGGRLSIVDKDDNPSTTNDASNIRAAPGKRFLLQVDPGGYLTIRNSVINGAGNSSIGPGIAASVNGTTISGNSFSGGYRVMYLVNSFYNQISNNNLLSDEDTFITLNGSAYTTINGNIVNPGASPLSTIRLYNSSSVAIYGNTFTNERDAPIYMQGPSSNNSIYNNNFNINNPPRGIDIENSANSNSIYYNSFSNSNPDETPHPLLYISSSNYNQFYSNTLTEATDIYMQNSVGNGIYSNTFFSQEFITGGFIISVYSSANDSISNNTFDNPGWSIRNGDVFLSNCNNELVSNNTMNGVVEQGNPSGAIYATGCSNTNVINNTIAEHHWRGFAHAIDLEGGSNEVIAYNNVTDTIGIKISTTNPCTVEYNTASNCDPNSGCYCISVSCSNAFIYQNTIINCNATGEADWRGNRPHAAGLYVAPQSLPPYGAYASVYQNNFTNDYIGVTCSGGSIRFFWNNFTNNVNDCSGCSDCR